MVAGSKISMAWIAALPLVVLAGSVAADVPISSLKVGIQQGGFEEDYETKRWEEIAVRLPAAPQKEKLISIYVSAATEHKFFIDPDSISLGKDGVARYTLVVKTSGGATNISYEGMRCETRERRAYAFGRSDGQWSKVRGSAWMTIREETANRHYAALFTDYLCPDGVMAGDVAAVLHALHHQGGGAPRVTVGQ